VIVDRDGQIRVRYKLNNVEGHDRPEGAIAESDETERTATFTGTSVIKVLFARNLYLGSVCRSQRWRTRTAPCVLGNDPKTSALDRNCKAQELDNLYVVDASFFPSSGAVNPALTIMANALRVGDHLMERLR
jgi:choline dehydrogenase-like flavoprotein